MPSNVSQRLEKYPIGQRDETTRLACVLKNLQFALLPGNCLLCGLATRRAMDLCEPCEQNLPWNLLACAACALPIQGVGLCDLCLDRKPVFDAVCAPFLYRDQIARLLSRAKFKAGLTDLALVSELCADRFALERPAPDVLIPVPLSWRRMAARGFNQSALLARHYGRRLRIPVRHGALKRRRHTMAQSGLTRRARLRNVAGAFEAGCDLSGKRVALVDDVFTTGATALAASKVLRKAGASRISVWVCARTPDA